MTIEIHILLNPVCGGWPKIENFSWEEYVKF